MERCDKEGRGGGGHGGGGGEEQPDREEHCMVKERGGRS
jgi:hypothetical protein